MLTLVVRAAHDICRYDIWQTNPYSPAYLNMLLLYSSLVYCATQWLIGWYLGRYIIYRQNLTMM